MVVMVDLLFMANHRPPCTPERQFIDKSRSEIGERVGSSGQVDPFTFLPAPLASPVPIKRFFALVRATNQNLNEIITCKQARAKLGGSGKEMPSRNTDSSPQPNWRILGTGPGYS
ncbi:hypothetical protein M8J75_016490 [Diaphorina citri]|nr:hypothetical protein M8J75_016490 [Diaphorina citri]